MKNIHFVGRNLQKAWPDLAELTELDCTTQPSRFRGGINNWIIQSYLHLKEPLTNQGYAVTIDESLREDAVNIAHRDCLNRIFGPYHRCYIVAIRADRAPVEVGQWEVLQNDLHDLSPMQRYVPFWPQPGLIPRDTSRANMVSSMAYFGRTGTATPWLQDPSLHQKLADMGVRFEVNDTRWFDYRNVDIVLAHRSESGTMLNQKPASKLINAWLAGTPALLGNEPAYLGLKRSHLDYMSVESAEDVLEHVRTLIADPALYQAMVLNGRERGQAYTVDAVRERWLRFLLDDVVPHARSMEASGRLGRGSVLLQAKKLLTQKLKSRVFKQRYANEIRAIQQANKVRVEVPGNESDRDVADLADSHESRPGGPSPASAPRITIRSR